jgi:hypothetical protein
MTQRIILDAGEAHTYLIRALVPTAESMDKIVQDWIKVASPDDVILSDLAYFAAQSNLDILEMLSK